MATKSLDVWIVDSDTVYREVPYTVVTDWLQQGRLLGDDRVRLAGQQQWHAISSVKPLAPFLPREESAQAADQAEALEPVEMGLTWKRPDDSEDDDVDMIPLIDISLVLLIFFMMSASVSSGVLSTIDTPGAKHQLAAISNEMWWLGIDTKSRAGAVEKDADGQALPWYSLGQNTEEMLPPTTDRSAALAKLGEKLALEQGEAKVRLRADRSLPIETVRAATLELQDLETRINRGRDAKNRLTLTIVGEVSEPQAK